MLGSSVPFDLKSLNPDFAASQSGTQIGGTSDAVEICASANLLSRASPVGLKRTVLKTDRIGGIDTVPYRLRP
jgi:hypothetical protein